VRQYATLRLLLWVPILWPHRVNWRILGAAAVASACALVVVQGAQVLFGVLRSTRHSPGAGWVHPTQSGVWQAVALVGLVGASSWGAWHRLVLSLPEAASLAVGIVFTGSRAAALSAMAGLAAMTAVPLAAPAGRRARAARRLAIMIAASAAIAVGASFASPYLGNKFRNKFLQTYDQVRRTIDDQANDVNASIPEYRIAMWKMGIEAWPSHPIAGWGIGSIPTIARDTEITHPTQDMRRVRMIHSTYLHALVEGGLVGAGLLLASMALGAKAAWAAVRNDVARAGPACAAVAWLVAAGFDGYHQSGGLLSIGMIVIPLACAPLPERSGD
jgi:O-antigen ligase